MILTVTPNACVDKTYRVEGFSIGKVHRPAVVRTYAGGKGINVARAYRALGGHPLVTGLRGGRNGAVIVDSLEREGLDHALVETEDESRLCIAVIDPETGSQTEVNETGPEVSQSEIQALERLIGSLQEERHPFCLALCGSLPPGIRHSFYGELGTLAARNGTPWVLDTSRMPLAEGIRGRPWMVKPNLAELAWLAGKGIESEESTIAEARTIAGTGDTIVCVTLGERGCIGLKDGAVWKAAPPAIEFVSGVGSGDSFLGAFLWSMEGGAEFPEALRLASAAGAANAEIYGSGFITGERVQALAKDVQLARLR